MTIESAILGLTAPNGELLSFSIHGKGLKLNSREDIDPHLNILRKMVKVEEVHFGGNTLGIEACEALAEVLKDLKSLKVADFADIFTGRLITEIPQALSAICNSLKDHTSLIELDLSDNAFGGRSADPIVPFLMQNRSFQVLKLNNNGLGPSGGAIIAIALLESARLSKAEGRSSQLRTIICGRNRLQDDSAPLFAQAFAAHGGLVDVRMPQNGIRMTGIAALAEGLSQNPNLANLDLQDNCAKGLGTRALARALPAWTKLRTLNLSECLLGTNAGISFAQALNQGNNRELETLQLVLNELDHRSLTILAEAIRNHLSLLTKLEINENRALPEDDCIEAIKAALAVHEHEDALDELDAMEEEWDDDDEEEEEEEGEEEEGEEKEVKKKELEEQEERAKNEEGIVTEKPGNEVDELAELMGKMGMGPSQNA